MKFGTEIFIDDNPILGDIKIWLREYATNGKTYALNFDKDNDKLLKRTIIEEYEIGIDNEPFIVLPRKIFSLLAQEIIDNRDRFRITPKEESFTKGKLEATEAHLKSIEFITDKLLTKITE